MKRRLLQLSFAGSVILFLTLCLLWKRSYSITSVARDGFNRGHPAARIDFRASSSDGEILLLYARQDLDPAQLADYEGTEGLSRYSYPNGSKPWPERGNFQNLSSASHGWFHFRDTSTLNLFGPYREVDVVVPYWALCMASGIALLFFLIRSLKNRHRVSHHRCVTCGYDLRATPNRCPECGTQPPFCARGH